MSKESVPMSIAGPKSKKKKVSKRCNFEACNKKLRLTDTFCRCRQRYCSIHRLPELHNCVYDYKTKDATAFMKRAGLGGGEVRKIEVI